MTQSDLFKTATPSIPSPLPPTMTPVDKSKMLNIYTKSANTTHERVKALSKTPH